MSAVTSLLTSCTDWLPTVPRTTARNDARTYAASCSSQRWRICGSTDIDLRVCTPVTASTRNAWFAAPRRNFSSTRRRSSGVIPTEMST